MQAARQIRVPPIKTQGIKTKLVGFISENIRYAGARRWVEPFLGSGAVLFNIAPDRALACESNIHIINLYGRIADGAITAATTRAFLEREGARLAERGESHYYELRDRFNTSHDPLDFLFLNRSCFNGVMRFNSRGGFNVPFCKKPNRFTRSYITKIANQIAWAGSLLRDNDRWRLEAIDWRDCIAQLQKGDFVYLDPPYAGRHTSYYDSWSEQDMRDLSEFLHETDCRFALSLWYQNRYRKNGHIEELFSDFEVRTFEHFYHVGSTESLRNPMIEALITN